MKNQTSQSDSRCESDPIALKPDCSETEVREAQKSYSQSKEGDNCCLQADDSQPDQIGLPLQTSRSFINLAYGKERSCPVPVDWFAEFILLKEGQCCRKEGFAWFYSSPHDQDECLYSAAVENDILYIEVEVGPEVLVRRAAFGLYDVKVRLPEAAA